MKVGLICPVWFPVPPEAYGGIERVVALLADGLVAGGHDVTLFASGESQTRARLDAVFPTAGFAHFERIIQVHLAAIRMNSQGQCRGNAGLGPGALDPTVRPPGALSSVSRSWWPASRSPFVRPPPRPPDCQSRSGGAGPYFGSRPAIKELPVGQGPSWILVNARRSASDGAVGHGRSTYLLRCSPTDPSPTFRHDFRHSRHSSRPLLANFG